MNITTVCTRRRFLQGGGGALGALATMPLWLRLGSGAFAATGPAPSGRKLLVMLLDGGNDGLNTLVPFGSDAYYERRPTIAYPVDQVLKLSDSSEVGLAPSLTNLQRLYEARQVAVVQGVGYDEPDLSHFGSMDIWQSGSPAHDQSSGWLGRYLDFTPDQGAVIRAVAISDRLPQALVGDPKSGVAVPSFGGFTFYDGLDADPTSEAFRLHEAFVACADARLEGSAAAALLSSNRQTVSAVRAVNRLGDTTAAPPATLADQVSMAIKLLASDLGVEIAFVSVGSFDDHAAQQNNHPGLLKEVDDAVGRFTTEVAALGRSAEYLLMTFSEFGRRVEEDGSAGTDHGTAAPMFMVGERVLGGLYGEHPSIDRPALDEDGNLVRTVEFREVYATVLDRWLGGGAQEVLGYSAGAGLHPLAFLP